MKIKGGYILQPRIIDNSSFKHASPCDREVWQFILRNVSHKDTHNLKRGTGFFKNGFIRDSLKWAVGARFEYYSASQITKAIRRQRESNMIATAKATRGMFITVCNYETYQDPNNYEGNAEGNTKATRRQHEGYNHKQEVKKERNNNIYIPTWDEFLKHGLAKKNNLDKSHLKLKFESWVENDWKDGNGKEIKNWKTKLNNTLPYINTENNNNLIY